MAAFPAQIAGGGNAVFFGERFVGDRLGANFKTVGKDGGRNIFREGVEALAVGAPCHMEIEAEVAGAVFFYELLAEVGPLFCRPVELDADCC